MNIFDLESLSNLNQMSSKLNKMGSSFSHGTPKLINIDTFFQLVSCLNKLAFTMCGACVLILVLTNGMESCFSHPPLNMKNFINGAQN